MARVVGIGHQNFETVRMRNNFYVDKTHFIKEWWESDDQVTLITRPRRFGKTLNMSMTEQFFSVTYAGRSDLFEGLFIWKEEKFRNLQGTYPVIFLSFADIKETNFEQMRKKMCRIVKELYNKFDFILESDLLNQSEKNDFRNISSDMEDNQVSYALKALSNYLFLYYGKKVIILLDEYDTPMQEAYISGYWEKAAGFIRNLFHATFKNNPYLERGIMTGITRVSKESVFSDLNHLKVVTATSEEYADSFGFTEEEVFQALDEFHLSEQRQEVRSWYDGFRFGSQTDIYNPWSIINYLDTGQFRPYWANTSSDNLIGKLVREGSRTIKEDFESLMRGEVLRVRIDEQIVYAHLENDEQALWSLLLAAGYLKVRDWKTCITEFGEWQQEYELELTNFEVKVMFRSMIRSWFGRTASDYNDFIRALLMDDLKAMNRYMNRVALATFSYFDTGKKPSDREPERFYHGFVLGLLVELNEQYLITSNRESGFGRYDVILEPRKPEYDPMILEFKVQDTEEKELSDTVKAALEQINRQNYEILFTERGIPGKKIRKYGFAFCGKQVMIGKDNGQQNCCKIFPGKEP